MKLFQIVRIDSSLAETYKETLKKVDVSTESLKAFNNVMLFQRSNLNNRFPLYRNSQAKMSAASG